MEQFVVEKSRVRTETREGAEERLLKGLQPEVRQEVQTKVQPEVQPEVQPNIRLKVQPEVQTKVQSEVQPNIRLKVQPEVQTKVQSEVQPKAQKEVQPGEMPEKQGNWMKSPASKGQKKLCLYILEEPHAGLVITPGMEEKQIIRISAILNIWLKNCLQMMALKRWEWYKDALNEIQQYK